MTRPAELTDNEKWAKIRALLPAKMDRLKAQIQLSDIEIEDLLYMALRDGRCIQEGQLFKVSKQ